MGQARKRGTKEERVKMAIIRDVFRKTQETEATKKTKGDAMVEHAYYILNTTFYDDDHDYLRRSYYGPSK